MENYPKYRENIGEGEQRYHQRLERCWVSYLMVWGIFVNKLNKMAFSVISKEIFSQQLSLEENLAFKLIAKPLLY